MIAASRGLKPKKPASKRSMPSRPPAPHVVGIARAASPIDAGGAQFVVGEACGSIRRRRAGCARAARRRRAPGNRPAMPTMAISAPCHRAVHRCSVTRRGPRAARRAAARVVGGLHDGLPPPAGAAPDRWRARPRIVGKRNRSVIGSGRPMISVRRLATCTSAANGRPGRRSCRRCRRADGQHVVPDPGDLPLEVIGRRRLRFAVRGTTVPGAGSARRSILPLGVSGRASSTTTARHHDSGSHAAQRRARRRRPAARRSPPPTT